MAEAAQVDAAAVNTEANDNFPELPGLTEDEEVFLAGEDVNESGGELLSVAGHGESSARELDNQFLHLAIRKQVSYR